MAVTESEVIGKHEALNILRAGREGSQAKAQSADPVKDAARTLGLRAAEARQAKAGQVPAAEKPAKPQQAAPLEDKPDDEAEDNAETAPEGQDVEEDNSQNEEVDASDDSDGENATIDIDGEKLTKQQIRDSYLRREDYTRKTQEVAERGKVLDHTLGVVTQNSQRLEQLVGILEQAVGQEPDWSSLAMQMQPQQYLAYQADWRQQKQVLDNVRNEQQKSVTNSIAQAKNAMIDEASRTFRPDWQDPAKRQDGITKLADYAVSEGILPQELQMLYRTPMLKILDQSQKWVELQKTQRITDKKVQNKPKPVRPGQPRAPGSQAANALEAERQIWESNKRPDSKSANRWLQAKRNYEDATGKRA